jgi:tetratricopeptide (TPR) repeat protein
MPMLTVLIVMAAVGATFWDPIELRVRQWRARRWLRQRDDVRAVHELQAALCKDLENSDTLLLLARAHRRLGAFTRMAGILDRAQALGGNKASIEQERRLALAQAGQIRDVEPFLADMLIASGDEDPDICHAFVQGYFANLRFDMAVRLLDAWQQSFPDDVEPYFLRAYMWQSMNQEEQAVTLYQEGLAKAPGRTVMRARLATALLNTNRLDEAERELRLCVEQTPDDADVHYSLARCAHARNDLDAAAQHLATAMASAPDHLDARLLRGQILLAQGQPDKALPDLQQVVARHPYDTFAREALGRTLRGLGRHDDAKPHLDFVAEAQPSIDRLNRLLRESIDKPQDAELRFQIGTILVRYGPPEDAAKWMQAVLELKPDHGEAHRALAAYFESTGDAAKASFHRARADAVTRLP